MAAGARPDNPPDERWLDGRDASLFQTWNPAEAQERRALEQFLAHIPPVKDDFVRIPLPRLADGDLGPALAAAEKEYAEQAKVVDTRLFRKVTLRLKAASLAEFCTEMKTQTGVELRPARGLDEEKVTALVKGQRARDVMRAVSRLFGYYWGRTGTADNFQYDLEQDLRSQLAEEELRNRDANAALLAMDTEMQKYRPYLSLPFDQLEKRFHNSDGEEHKLLFMLVVGGGWAPAQLYARLSPVERAALAAGQELVYSVDAADPARRLPAEWREALTRSTGFDLSDHEATDEPPQVTQVRLQVDRSELGQVSLSRHFAIRYPKSRASSSSERAIATGRSLSALKPDNATLNAALKEQPLFKRVVTVKPQVSCPRFRVPRPPDSLSDRRWTSHVTSADVWEAVHDATGMNIVADAYTRLHPQSRAVVQDQPLFDVLCREGDLLDSRWKQDGEFLLCRSTSYFWDKLKEVPTRLLRHWSADRQANGGLPLADFLEIGGLTDQQLGSRWVADAAAHCWDLPEWDAIGGGSLDERFTRTDARFVALLTPKQLEQAQTRDGLVPAELTPRQQRAFVEVVATRQRAMERQNGEEPHFPRVSAITLEYVPAGWYLWRPSDGIDRVVSPDQPPNFSGRDPKQVLAAVRRFFPNAKLEEIERQPVGQFSCGLRFGPFPVGK